MPEWLKRVKKLGKSRSKSIAPPLVSGAVDTSSSTGPGVQLDSSQPIDRLSPSFNDLLAIHSEYPLGDTKSARSQPRSHHATHIESAINTIGDDPQALGDSLSIRGNVGVQPVLSDESSQPHEERKSAWPQVAYSTFKIGLAITAEAANAFTPLKIAVGTLSVLLSNYDVRSCSDLLLDDYSNK
jgi:hypothetical protein